MAPLSNVIEGESVVVISDEANKFDCEARIPSMALVEQESEVMKASIEAEVNINNIDLILLRENKFRLKTCSVSEHSMEGLAEHNIRSVAKSLEADGILRMKLHTTGFQTILKLIKNNLDKLLFGYSCGCSQVSSTVLKLIFPNLLRIG